MSKAAAKQPWSLRRKLVLGVVITVIVLGLALGLGLGLTIGRNNGGDDEGSEPTSTSSVLPTPTSRLPWYPQVNDTWQIILSGTLLVSPSSSATPTPSLTPNVSIFTIDLFDTPAETISTLRSLGKRVICYFSAGSYEDWREDAKEFEKEDLGNDLDGWPGEKWLRLGSENVRRIMKERVELAGSKGCDGVDPDNVDGFDNDNGLDLTPDDSISFINYLSTITIPLNLTLGLKNAASIIDKVLPVVHFSVNEECAKYEECNELRPFIEAGKPVFHIEYPEGSGGVELKADVMNKYCGKSGGGGGDDTQGFTTVLKNMNLDGWVQYCDGEVEISAVNGTEHNHHGEKRRKK